MKFDFNNKTVLITGGAKGIGLGIAKMYLKSNAEVIITYNNSLNEAVQLLRYSNINSYKLKIFKLDLGDLKSLYSFLHSLKLEIKKIDILINNSGVCNVDPFIFQEDYTILSMININFSNTLILTKNILKDFMDDGAKIINISSIWGRVGSSCEVVYSSTKAAINLFTKSLSKEMVSKDIKILGIAPGFIETDMNNNVCSEERKEILSEIPLGRIGKVFDIVNAVKFFSSSNVGLSGEIINVDGGWYL